LVLWVANGRPTDAKEPLHEAATLLSDVGQLDEFADAKDLYADLVANTANPSGAVKAFEEAAAVHRKLAQHAQLHGALAYEAGQLIVRGDLDLGATRLREAVLESEAIGEAASPLFALVEGGLAQARVDMDGVRKAIHSLRAEANPTDPSEAEPFAVWLEAIAFRAQDRLSEAREMFEKRRTFKETTGHVMEAFNAQTELCELLCEEGHPLQGLECLSQHQPPAATRTAWSVPVGRMLTTCRYLAGDLQGAETAAVEAVATAQHYELYDERVLTNAYLMRARAARGETTQAIASLRTDLAEAEAKGAKSLAFEVSLALGEIELRVRRPGGRPRLLRLEQEAKSKEFFRIARLAREALAGKAATTPPK